MAEHLRAAVREMKAYTPGEQINDAIKLNTNECAWGPAPGVLKAVGEISVDQLRLYPSPMADRVRAAAADVFEVSAGQVLVGNGSDDCLTVVMRSFLSPGDKCACPWPTYSLYDTLATIQGVDIVHAAWQEAPDPLLKAKGISAAGGVEGYNLPITELLASGAKVIFVATPNNPSATLVPLAQLDLLAAELNGILVVDEAYIDYATKADGTSAAGLSASFIPRLASRPNVLVLRTFSKSYSMAGARLGLMFASEELINHMNKVKDSYNVNALTQVAGEAALKDREYFNWLIGATIAERTWLQKEVSSFGWSWPRTDANFALFDVGSPELAAALYARLKAAGLLVRYWGARPDLCSKLRVTVGARPSNEKFVKLVREALADPKVAALVPANGKGAKRAKVA